MSAKTPRARGDVVFRPLADQWVIFDPRRQLLHVLNHTAALVWTRCDGETAIEEVVGELESVFERPPPRGDLQRDVHRALDGFRAQELLEP